MLHVGSYGRQVLHPKAHMHTCLSAWHIEYTEESAWACMHCCRFESRHMLAKKEHARTSLPLTQQQKEEDSAGQGRQDTPGAEVQLIWLKQ